jgi:hypothetical protein
MMRRAFVLATVPLAGMSYVLLVGLARSSPCWRTDLRYLGDRAHGRYTGVVIVNLNWNAFLFVSHFLVEAQLRKEVAAREQAQQAACRTDDRARRARGRHCA